METCRELAIASLSSDGRGIAARAPDEPVTFVAGALPGETVLVQIMADRKRFREARAIEILSQAPDAAEPCCPHATECGGCPLMRMAYPAQLTWKRRIVQDAFVRIGHLEGVQAAPVLPSPLTDGFRNKMELAFGLDAEGRLRLGMRRRSGHDIIATPQCRLMDAQARALACAVEAACARERLSVYEPDTAEASPACGSGPCDRRGRGGRGGQQGSREQGKGFLRFCQIRSGIVPDEACTGFAMPGQGQQAYWILLVTSRGADAETATLRRIARELLDAFPALHAVIHEERKACDFLRQGDRRSFALCRQGEIPEAARLLAPLGERRYLIDCAGFFQVNTRSAEKLAELAGQGLVSGNLLDL
ncbi:MAG: class I SAM-dependent RNA methyltransferase, partial [Desulfovibrio sp.]|nr:class I SAM-dependent RNA methyltransferase [Desulfovibrio sp.]